MKFKKKSVIIDAVQFIKGPEVSVMEFLGLDDTCRCGNSLSFCNDVAQITIYQPKVCTLIIKTLEGDMTAADGDYIIKGINGEFYPCKPDIFEKTYVKVDESHLNFGDAIEVLKQGGAIRRKGWNGKGMFVVKQIPAHITEEIIPKMQSLPQSAKDLIMARENKYIDYTNQMLIINPDGRADSWVPSSSDIFAEDWEIIL